MPPSGPMPVHTCSAACQAERAGKDTQPAEQRLLRCRQQLIAPRHGGPHAQLPGRQVDRAVRQQAEHATVVRPIQLASNATGDITAVRLPRARWPAAPRPAAGRRPPRPTPLAPCRGRRSPPRLGPLAEQLHRRAARVARPARTTAPPARRVSPSRLRLVTSTARSGMAAWIWLTRVAPPASVRRCPGPARAGRTRFPPPGWPTRRPPCAHRTRSGRSAASESAAVQARKMAPATPDRSQVGQLNEDAPDGIVAGQPRSPLWSCRCRRAR